MTKTYQHISGYLDSMDQKYSGELGANQNGNVLQDIGWAISMFNFFQSLRERILLDDRFLYIKYLYDHENELYQRIINIIGKAKQTNYIELIKEVMKRFFVDFRFNQNEG